MATKKEMELDKLRQVEEILRTVKELKEDLDYIRSVLDEREKGKASAKTIGSRK